MECAMESTANDRVASAQVACDKAVSHWQAAAAAINGDVSLNGYGIIRDRSAFRQKLHEAQARIAASLAALDEVESWPSSVDYDEL
jgi:hypothetical protein